ncbi:MAG: small basic family protein [Chloroherpetonaceae bacterium]|nr:small basic family protein [Chthonomonadaceae bacterium]MDW8208447.1 small basic family protein [Chloroherpetonaceae bacterium]
MKTWLLPVLSLCAGFALGYALLTRLNWYVPAEYAPYLSVAALAGLDTIFGGIRAGIEGRFQNDIFASGFLLNTLLAAGLAWLGDRIGVSLALVAVIALGSRVFLNLSLIRRYYLNKLALARSRQQEEVTSVSSLPAPALSQKPELQ